MESGNLWVFGARVRVWQAVRSHGDEWTGHMVQRVPVGEEPGRELRWFPQYGCRVSAVALDRLGLTIESARAGLELLRLDAFPMFDGGSYYVLTDQQGQAPLVGPGVVLAFTLGGVSHE